jgi:hypothetical protein
MHLRRNILVQSSPAPVFNPSKARPDWRVFLFTILQVRVRVADRSRYRVEGKTRRLGRELYFGADVEECKVAGHQMVRHTCRLILEGKSAS